MKKFCLHLKDNKNRDNPELMIKIDSEKNLLIFLFNCYWSFSKSPMIYLSLLFTLGILNEYLQCHNIFNWEILLPFYIQFQSTVIICIYFYFYIHKKYGVAENVICHLKLAVYQIRNIYNRKTKRNSSETLYHVILWENTMTKSSIQ